MLCSTNCSPGLPALNSRSINNLSSRLILDLFSSLTLRNTFGIMPIVIFPPSNQHVGWLVDTPGFLHLTLTHNSSPQKVTKLRFITRGPSAGGLRASRRKCCGFSNHFAWNLLMNSGFSPWVNLQSDRFNYKQYSNLLIMDPLTDLSMTETIAYQGRNHLSFRHSCHD